VGGFLIDTNVISEFVKPEPSLRVKRWFEAADPESLFASVITFGEIRIGIEDLAEGKRRAALEQWLEQGVPDWFQANLLPVTKAITDRWGQITVQAKRKGMTRTNRGRLDCRHRHRARVDHCDA
jgi:predicted nucleic acid-binding protein